MKLREIQKGKIAYYPRTSKCEHIIFTDIKEMCAAQ
jgi:hypothetical protein